MRKIKKLKASKFSRSFFALKTSAKLLPKLLSKEISPEDILYSLIGKDIEKFVNDVGSLKGSFLKASQLLSSYGEYYFPNEINQILKKVQNQSLVLEWDKIKPHLDKKLFKKYDIQSEAMAAASIGQVHRAKNIDSGKEVVIKIQYPGVRKAIDLDILILKKLLGLSKLIPRGIVMDDIYFEIKKVLEEEMNYPKEIEKHRNYKEWIESYNGYKVPLIYDEVSAENIIISEYIKYPTLSEIDPDSLGQVDRNLVGERILRLFFLEIFKGEYIQTDCHPGNYHLDNEGNIYIIDFGAVLKYERHVILKYQTLIKSLYLKNRKNFFKTLDLINNELGSELIFDQEQIWNYCQLAISPLYADNYDWGTTDLPDRLLAKAKELISTVKIEKPPHHFIFLDRKLLGVFSILRKFESRINMLELSNEFLKD